MSDQVKEPVFATRRIESSDPLFPYYHWHPSFDEPDAETTYSPEFDPPAIPPGKFHLDNAISDDLLMRMNYAAHRHSLVSFDAQSQYWKIAYLKSRDFAVLGNLSSIKFAIRRYDRNQQWFLDIEGDCLLDLLTLVNVFDPWYGCSFFHYLVTCMRRNVWHRRVLRNDSLWKGRTTVNDNYPETDWEGGDVDHERIRVVLAKLETDLNPKHRQAVELFFGLNGQPRLTPRDGAVVMRCTAAEFSSAKEYAVRYLRRKLTRWDY